MARDRSWDLGRTYKHTYVWRLLARTFYAKKAAVSHRRKTNRVGSPPNSHCNLTTCTKNLQLHNLAKPKCRRIQLQRKECLERIRSLFQRTRNLKKFNGFMSSLLKRMTRYVIQNNVKLRTMTDPRTDQRDTNCYSAEC